MEVGEGHGKGGGGPVASVGVVGVGVAWSSGGGVGLVCCSGDEGFGFGPVGPRRSCCALAAGGSMSRITGGLFRIECDVLVF